VNRKSSLLGIVSGEFPPTSGTAQLGGLDIINDSNQIRNLIGYCPQFDSLFDLLTGREHLELYARIKGIKPQYVNSSVNLKLSEMALGEYGDRSAGTYSGGWLSY
jgi:ABC-type multidrug transport system ATPase subunit